MPNDPNAPENAVDMDRYYYRPGTTEPELRPEFANAPAEPEAKPLRGKLPDGFPHRLALEHAGINTYAQARKAHASGWEDVSGIGEAKGADIAEALGESSPDEEESE